MLSRVARKARIRKIVLLVVLLGLATLTLALLAGGAYAWFNARV